MIGLALFAMATALVVTGMAGIAWAMPQHHERLGRRPPNDTTRHCARVAGWVLLGAALPPCAAGWGGSIGFVLWVGLLTVGVLAVAGTLALLGTRHRA
ncbi:DUF3325 domain-containing protein [Thauera chlorobenzoica]|uniref:DUF3325 domain-containing protein n=1 Tax=Thauera chlorobenzoica TaxID=96773 RepID=UPI0008A04627|nr:DUF3325 domain-containing protein [Thauera chlorobenzoica]SEF53716.1 Protein of unknown function [Thauera chlorobenzoica]